MVRFLAGCPHHAVRSVHFGVERSSDQSGAETVLGQPGRELSIAVEGVSTASVAADVVNSPTLVVGAPGAVSRCVGQSSRTDSIGPIPTTHRRV